MTTAKTKGSGFLKVTGILMIIGGGISIILGIIAALGVAALAYISDGEISSAMLYASVALMIVSAVAQLIAGIIGVRKPLSASALSAVQTPAAPDHRNLTRRYLPPAGSW